LFFDVGGQRTTECIGCRTSRARIVLPSFQQRGEPCSSDGIVTAFDEGGAPEIERFLIATGLFDDLPQISDRRPFGITIAGRVRFITDATRDSLSETQLALTRRSTRKTEKDLRSRGCEVSGVRLSRGRGE
jgi:hypothetical protein